MAVTFVAASLGPGLGASAAVTPDLPAGMANDDIMIMVCETAGTQGLSTPTDWNVLDQAYETGDSTTGTRLSVFWKRVVGGETAPTVGDSGDHQCVKIFAYRGCRSQGNPWNAVTGGVDATAGTSVSITGVTTTVANCLVLNIICTPFDTSTSNQVDGWTNGNLSGITERGDTFTTASNGGGHALADGTKATAGATGSTSVTLTNSAVAAFMTVALDPTVTPGPPQAAVTSTANDPLGAVKSNNSAVSAASAASAPKGSVGVKAGGIG